jgi:hypothetical protein
MSAGLEPVFFSAKLTFKMLEMMESLKSWVGITFIELDLGDNKLPSAAFTVFANH